MIDPFFDYIKHNREANSNVLYGDEVTEKRYGQIPYVNLPRTPELDIPLSTAFSLRRSTRDYSQEPLSQEILARILEHSIGRSISPHGGHRAFPSAGGLYPLETYVAVRSVSGFDTGLYHYSTENHALAPIRPMSAADIEDKLYIMSKMMQSDSFPSVFILMTFLKSRCFKKYGALSYMHVAFEAGHRAQNICLVAASLDIGICPLGGAVYEEMNEFLNIDGMNENYLYALALGLPK